MSFIQITKDELKTLGKNKIKLVAITAIIIIPLLYSFLYLKAYWDPYSNLKNYHIAVVNNDKGAIMDDENKNYGSDIIDKLKDNNDVGFEFVDDETAYDGLKNDKYFAEIQIPEDFSQNIVNAKNGKIINPKINYITNNKKNYIGTKISDSIKNEILKEINGNISKNYGEVAFNTIYELKDGLKDASDGASKLADGEDELYDGGKELSNGLGTLNSQVEKLKNGVGSLQDGSAKLNDGLGELYSKMPTLSDSTGKLVNGANALKEGMASAKNGASKITANSNNLKNGAENLNSIYDNQVIPGYKQLTTGLKQGADNLNSGASQVRDGVNSLIATTTQSQQNLAKALTSAEGSLKEYLSAHPEEAQDPNLQTLLATMQGIKTQMASSGDSSKSIKELQNGLDSLVQGTQSLSNELDLNNSSSAVSTYYAGLNSFKNEGIKAFTSGVNAYVDGTDKLASGINDLSKGSSDLYNGMDALNSNMPALSAAASKLYAGSSALKDGTNELNSKMPELVSGVGKLADGSNKLTDGISSLKDGTLELNDGLTDGVQKIEDNIKSSSKDLGEFMGEPVKVSEETKGSADCYGSGLAPYFLPISIWLGAVFALLAIKINNKNYKELSNLKLTIGKYIPYALLGIVQAFLLGGIVLWLGIKPTNLPLLFAFLILMALSFDAIIYTLISLFGLAGEAIAVILLVLQLCSDAGTFPMEVLPSFFKGISTYLPFTYSVSALREILFSVNINTSLLMKDSIALVVFGVVFMAVNTIFIRKGEAINTAIEDNLAA